MSGRDGYARLETPVITELHRLDSNRVKIKWTCTQPSFSPFGMQDVKLVILRQALNEEWQQVETRAWSAQGEWTDPAADIATVWRYSAITTVIATSGGTIAHTLDAGSDAASPQELDYVTAIYAMLGYRSSLSQYTLAPPGHDLNGSAPRDDWFSTTANSYDGKAPSFIPTNPPLPSGQDAPLTFTKQETRYFAEAAPGGSYTELSTAGYVIRGKPFKISADARVTYYYPGCLLAFDPMGSLGQPNRIGTAGTGVNQKGIFKLNPIDVEVMQTHYEGAEEKGFDAATYFACQHLRGGVSDSDGKRNMKMRYVGTGNPATLSKTGPIDKSNETVVANGINFDLKANSNAFNESANVEESTNHRKLKAITLKAQTRTIGIYPAVIYDVPDGSYHYPPPLPDAGTLASDLNDIFGRQANVTFNVVLKPQITINLINPSGSAAPAFPAAVNSMKGLLWTASDQEDLTLFWIEQMKNPGTIAEAFDIDSQGAVIGPSGSTKAIAHELGHCLGLFHCWQPDSVSALTKIADSEAKRLMGYDQNGKLLRSKEIVKVNQWTPHNQPLGPN